MKHLIALLLVTACSGPSFNEGSVDATGGAVSQEITLETGGYLGTGGSSSMPTGGNATGRSTVTFGLQTGGNISTGGSSSPSPQYLCSFACVQADGACWKACANNSVSMTGTLNSPTNCYAGCTTQAQACISACPITANSCVLGCGTASGTCLGGCFTNNYVIDTRVPAIDECYPSCDTQSQCTAGCVGV